MSAHIPEYRRAGNVRGARTWAQTWQPEAVEHYRRRTWRDALAAFFLAVAIGVTLAALVAMHI